MNEELQSIAPGYRYTKTNEGMRSPQQQLREGRDVLLSFSRIPRSSVPKECKYAHLASTVVTSRGVTVYPLRLCLPLSLSDLFPLVSAATRLGRVCPGVVVFRLEARHVVYRYVFPTFPAWRHFRVSDRQDSENVGQTSVGLQSIRKGLIQRSRGRRFDSQAASLITRKNSRVRLLGFHAPTATGSLTSKALICLAQVTMIFGRIKVSTQPT
jgi:hypothetical protein